MATTRTTRQGESGGRAGRAAAPDAARPDRAGDVPHWRIGEAKQAFSEVVRRAAEEPQMIYNRDRLVAAVVGGSALAELLEWRDRQAGASVASAFAGLRALAAEAGEPGWRLEVPERRDRPSPFD